MYKVLIWFFLVMSQGLIAGESIYTESNNAIKMIEKSNIQFIAVEKSIKEIKGSKLIDFESFFSRNILGKQLCTPLYSCPNKLEKYFSIMGISNNQPLVLYDNSYGIYSAALYTMLESMGHKNITILNGGIKAISKIDPNQKSYTKYRLELKNLKNNKNKDKNVSSAEDYNSMVMNLEKKLEVLKPHLLVQKRNNEYNISKTEYRVSQINTDYLLSKNDLEIAVNKVRLYGKESNISIVDVCPMVDIVGNKYGTYITGVKTLSWKNVIDRKNQQLKGRDTLALLFTEIGLNKNNNNYLYCMAGSPKALYIMTIMRELGYSKVKAFTGDWNVWTGDINE